MRIFDFFVLIKKNFHFLKLLSTSYVVFFVQTCAMIFQTPLFIQSIGVGQYGIWILMQNITNYLILFNFGFINNLIAEYIKIKHDDSDKDLQLNRLFSSVFFTILVTFILTVPVILFLYVNFNKLFVSDIGNDSNQILLLILYVGFLSTYFSTFFEAINQYVIGSIFHKNLIEIAKIVLSNIGFHLILRNQGTLIDIAFFLIFINAFFLFVNIIYSKRYLSYKISFQFVRIESIRQYVKPSLHFLFLNAIYIAIFNSDNILIGILLGTEYIYIYAISFRLTDISSKLIRKVTEISIPKMVNLLKTNQKERLKNLYSKIIIIQSILAVLAGIVISLFGGDILILWLGPTIDFDQNVIYVFSVYITVYTVYFTNWTLLNVSGNHSFLSIISIIELTINISLSVLLCRYLGIFGIGLATLVSTLICSFWYSIFKVKKMLS